MSLFEEAGLVCAPARRVHGKHKAPVVLPPQPPVPVKRPLKRPAPKAKAKAKAKAKVKKAAVKAPSLDELLSTGQLPEEGVDRYEALCDAPLEDLKEMCEQAWLSTHGPIHQLALRITRQLAGLDPLDEDAAPEDAEAEDAEAEDAEAEDAEAEDAEAEPVEPKKAAPKRKLRGGKMGAASRLRMAPSSRGRGRGRAGGSRAVKSVKAPKVPKSTGPTGPSKKKMRLFLTQFLEDVDVQTTTFGELRAAAELHFGALSEEQISALSDVAAVAMRKQLGARKAAPVEAPVEKEEKEQEDEKHEKVLFCFLFFLSSFWVFSCLFLEELFFF